VKFRGGKPGEFAEIKVTRSDAHDLHGELL
jgi:hypothetical protein